MMVECTCETLITVTNTIAELEYLHFKVTTVTITII